MNRQETPNKKQLFQFITEISFAMDETVLFLDTHPCDKKAMRYYEELRMLRQKAVDEYTNCFGPLNKYDVNPANEWQWVETPWPWEGVCS